MSAAATLVSADVACSPHAVWLGCQSSACLVHLRRNVYVNENHVSRTRALPEHAYPREIDFVDALPKTPSGKIQRFKLRPQAAAQTETR